MKVLEQIRVLRNNAEEINNFFNTKIPAWERDKSHYDKTGYGFNEDVRFRACSPVTVSFSSWMGTYGSSSCSTQLSLDADLFSSHLLKYLNQNKKEIMLSISKSILEEAAGLKSKAEKELNDAIEKLKELDESVKTAS